MFYKNQVTGMSITSALFLVSFQSVCVEYYFKWTIGQNSDLLRNGVFTVKFVWLEQVFIRADSVLTETEKPTVLTQFFQNRYRSKPDL